MKEQAALQVLKAIEQEAAQQNGTPSRKKFLPIIGPEKGQVLVDLVTRHQPSHVLEIGTLVGYSSILMGIHLPDSSRITSLEIDAERARKARENIKKAGMGEKIDVFVGNAIDVIDTLDGPYDMLFIDGAKDDYWKYFQKAEPKLADRAVIAADNAGKFAENMKEYLEYVRNNTQYRSRTIDFGFDAVEVTVKQK